MMVCFPPNETVRICLLLLFFTSSLCAAQRECTQGKQCISLLECPSLLTLIRSGNRANINTVRQAICGFQGRSSLVCCDAPPTAPVSTSTSGAPTLGNVNDLLPRRCGRPASEDKIIGGHPAPIGAYPWMAAFGYKEPGVRNLSFVCSGSIINSRYVLTAAHCVSRGDLGRRRLEVIHLGDWNLASPEDCQVTRIGPDCSPPHIVAGVEDIIIHPDYNTRGRSSDDIALIRLNMTIDFDRVQANVEPVCLPPNGFDVRGFIANRRPIAAGWGLTEHGNFSSIMLRIDLPVADEELCRTRYQSDYVGNQLCIGGESGSDTCSADSGGPLVISETDGPPFMQIGIVSFGSFPCALQSFPGVYTSVVDYRSWILSKLRS